MEKIELKKYLFAIAFCFVAMACYAQNAKATEAIYIIEGLFFREVPVDFSLTDGVMSIKTANGTQAYGISVKEPLSEAAKKFAVSEEEIPEADVLLEMYQERLGRMKQSYVATEELLKTGDKFPRFVANDIDGKEWRSEDVEGKVMVLNCWFTGCDPCRAEMPELSQWKNEMPDVMFFSATYEKPETARPVLEKIGFNWIHLVRDKQFKNYIGNNGYPMTIVVDKNGIIAQIEYGTSPLQRESLKKTIQNLR